jgi:DNA-binding response OmpR family regulator
MTAPAKCRVLVVDDNVDTTESLAILLRLMGHEVETAFDGLAAIEATAAFRPDVVLLDISLPKLNGYEAALRIRAQRPDGVVVIALTGWGREEDRRRTREAGFDLHLTKPVDPEELEKLLAGLSAGCA